jgi:spore maturation protein SpmA
MFLVLHTSGLTLIPLAIMAQRAVLGRKTHPIFLFHV